GDKIVAQKDVPVKAGEDLREVLTFVPPKGKDREEKTTLTTEIKLKENDAFKDSLTRPLRIIDSKVKVLYVEYAPRWEYKFLMTALLRDRRVEAKIVLVMADEKTLVVPGHLSPDQKTKWPYLQEFPTEEKLLEYDLVILGDVPLATRPGLSAAQQKRAL